MDAGGANIKTYVPNDLGDMIFTDDLKKRMARFQNIKKISDFTDADTKELVSVIIDLIPNLAAAMLGIKFKFNKKLKGRMLKNIFPLMKNYLKAISEIEKYPENPDKVREILQNALNDFSKEAFGKPFIEYIQRFYERKILNVKRLSRFFIGTKFLSYCKLSKELIDEVNNDPSKITKINTLFENLTVSEDMLYTVLPPSKLFKNIGWIHRPVKKWSNEVLQKVNDSYGSLSGIYEKQIRLVNAIIRIIEGNDMDYNKIHNDNLANNVDFVKNNKKYSELGDFDVVMRNAINHSTILPNINNKTVTYKDRKKSVTCSYKDTLQKTRNLSALIYSLILMIGYTQYLNILRLKAVFAQNKIELQ